jgi:hypothetical protein
MTVVDVGETDFVVIVYREEAPWEADVLPVASTVRVVEPSISEQLGPGIRTRRRLWSVWLG